MAARTIGSIDPGDIDAEVADRAAGRIRDYLEGHPEEDLIEVQGDVGLDDALVIPRPTAVVLAQRLDAPARGQGVQIMPKAAELTPQQAAGILNVPGPHLISLL